MSTATANVTTRAVRGGESLIRHVRSALNSSAGPPAGTGQGPSGWLVVTVLCDPSRIDKSDLPAPLAQMSDLIDVRVRPAPAGKGTELRARLRGEPSSAAVVAREIGEDQQSDVRSALRQAKQLIEVGEVLAVDPAPHGRRTASPAGLLVEAWTKVASKAGVR